MKKLFALIWAIPSFILCQAQTSLTWTRDTGSVTAASKVVTATDNYGNVYVAGTVSGTGGTDWQIVKYDPGGETLWSTIYNGSGNGADVVAAVKVDMSRNVYICGTTQGSSNTDITVKKLDQNGSNGWTYSYSVDGASYDEAYDMFVNDTGAVYVTGATKGSSSGTYNYYTLSIAPNGSVSWTATYSSADTDDDVSTAIVVHGSYVYVTGYSTTATSDLDITTRCYNSSGSAVWTKTNSGQGTTNKIDKGTCLAVESSGTYVYVGGVIGSTSTNTDYILFKYATSNGTKSWHASYDGPTSGLDAINDLAVDGSGYIYVTGSSEDGTGDDDYATIRYSSSGSVQWTQRYDGPGGGSDKAYALVIDGADVIVTGKSLGSSTIDFATLSYTISAGTVNWTMRYNETYSGSDYASDVTIDNMGKVLVAGTVQTGYSTHELGLISYFQPTKNSAAITKNLEMLARGLLNIYTSTVRPSYSGG